MRLDRVYIDGFKNLRAVDVDFDETSLTTVVIGQNGTGKSNLIEEITEVFRFADLGQGKLRFRYKIDYIIGNHHVTLTNLDGKSAIIADDKPLSRSAFEEARSEYFPDLVFGYYSGGSRKLERLFDDHQRRYYSVINKDAERGDYESARKDRRLFYCRPVHGALALLSFFAFPDSSVQELLSERLGIVGFHSALAHFREPSWFNATKWRASLRKSKAGNSKSNQLGHHSFADNKAPQSRNIWGAMGPAGECARRLRDIAFHPLALEGRVIDDYRDKQQTEMQLACFIRNGSALRDFANIYSDDKEMFAALEAIDISDLLREFHVWVKRKDEEAEEVNFSDLSDGERQLLMVLGLIRVSRGQRALFLLDEPDTHLNPVWQYSYLELLEQWMGVASERKNCHIVLTTHNPLVVGGLKKKQVRVLHRYDDKVSADEPEDDPIGMGIEGLLKSNLFGLRSTLAPEIIEKMDRHYRLLGIPHPTEEEKSETRKLAIELNQLAFATSHPNPYFEQFAKAMAKRKSLEPRRAVSPQDILSQTQLAEQLLDEILFEQVMHDQIQVVQVDNELVQEIPVEVAKLREES